MSIVPYEPAKTTVAPLPPDTANVFVSYERARTRERNRPTVAKQPAVVYLTTYAALNVSTVSSPVATITTTSIGQLSAPIPVSTPEQVPPAVQEEQQYLNTNPYVLTVGTSVKQLSPIKRKTRVVLILAASTNTGVLWLVPSLQSKAGQGVPLAAGAAIAIGNEAMTDRLIDMTKIYLIGTNPNDTAYILELYSS